MQTNANKTLNVITFILILKENIISIRGASSDHKRDYGCSRVGTKCQKQKVDSIAEQKNILLLDMATY